MNRNLVITICVIAVPLVLGYDSEASESSEDADAIAPPPKDSNYDAIIANAALQPSSAEETRLARVQKQATALDSSPLYRAMKKSEAISESIAETRLSSNIQKGNVELVGPNIIEQSVFRSLLTPTECKKHQIIATRRLPPMVVYQPASSPAMVSSGPAAVVKAAPVIYRMKPSVIYHHEVINKVPPPVSLNPVYVKVYKPGRMVDAPVAAVMQPVYNGGMHSRNGYDGSSNRAPAYPMTPGGSGAGYVPDDYSRLSY